MKIFVALLVACMAVALAQGSYVPTSYWPSSHSTGWNSWNNGWNSWNGHHQAAAYPYAKSWTSAWPATNLYNNGWDGAYGAVERVSSGWGQPWGTYGAGWSYQNVAKTIVPSVKVNAWSQPWGSYGAADWGYQQNVAKTIVPSGHSWGLPWGSYGAGAYGWEQPQVIKTVAPQVVKQVAYVAPAPIGVEKVLVH